MKWFGVALCLVLAACIRPVSGPAQSTQTLAEARQGFVTNIAHPDAGGGAPPDPSDGVLRLITYPAPLGDNAAYLTPPPKGDARQPAIIWITGGDANSIGDVWTPNPPDNDQSAAAFRQAGIVEMYPSLRGGNENPGHREGFYGEVDDILAAADYLAKLPYVDPARIYLGGHSTGGTLVLLTAEISTRFRDVFAFGPADDVRGYGGDFIPQGMTDPTELKLRSPMYWLNGIASPVFVLEGDGLSSNIDALRALQAATTNPNVHFMVIAGATHFSDLAPTTALIARKILADTGPTTNVAFTAAEAASLMSNRGAGPPVASSPPGG